MSYIPATTQPPKQSPCNRGCGRLIHFNAANPARLPNNKMAPLEYVQTAQGVYEVQHDCPVWKQQQAAAQAQQPIGPLIQGPIVQGAVPQQQPIPQIASGPSITQLMLEELKAIRAVLERLEKRTTPAAEVIVQPPAQEQTPDDFQAAEDRPPAAQ